MDFRLPVWLKPGLVLVLLACVLLFSGLNSSDLRGSTEPREAGVAADMLQSNQFLIPTLNGRTFLEKPPLSYWLQAASIKVFGYEAFAPRLPSVLAGIASVLLFAFFFRKSEQKHWLTVLAGTLLISMAFYCEYSRTAGQDILLSFGVSLALLSFYFTRESDSRGLWLGFSTGIAIATLTKGVVGLAVPGVVILVYLFFESIYFDKRFVISNWINPAVYALLGLLPILVWLWLLFGAQGMDAVKEVLWSNSVGRFQGNYSAGAHAEPFHYYLKLLPETFLPWSLMLYVAIWQSVRVLTKNRRTLFFFCWLVVPYILLSISSGKRPSYLLMLYPAAAALLAHFIVSFALQAATPWPDRTLKNAKWLLAIQATIFSVSTLFVLTRLVRIHIVFLAVVLVLLAIPILLLMWRSVFRLRVFHFAASCVGIVLITYIPYFSFVAPHDDAKRSARSVMQKLASFADAERPLALYQPSERMEGASSFYLQRRSPTINSEEELTRLLGENPATVVLVEQSSQLGLTPFKDEAQLNYGKDVFHYLSGK